MRIIIDGDIYFYEKVFSVKEHKYIDSEFPNISTKIYLEYERKFFPDDQWTDLTNSVLEMWTHNLLINKDLVDKKFTLYFMDGPYRLDIIKDNNMNLKINCINGRTSDISELIIECNYKEFLSALYDAYKTFINILYCNKMYQRKFVTIYNQAVLSMNKIKSVL